MQRTTSLRAEQHDFATNDMSLNRIRRILRRLCTKRTAACAHLPEKIGNVRPATSLSGRLVFVFRQQDVQECLAAVEETACDLEMLAVFVFDALQAG
jgi:hypothetical protein